MLQAVSAKCQHSANRAQLSAMTKSVHRTPACTVLFPLQVKLQCDIDTKMCVCAGGTKLTDDGSECVEVEAYGGDVCPPSTKKCLGVT